MKDMENNSKINLTCLAAKVFAFLLVILVVYSLSNFGK